MNALRAFCRKHPEAQVSPASTDEYNFYLVGETCNFWLRLITRRGDYNMYLHAFTKDERFGRYYEYLEQLRLSGKINMFDAVPYLQETFPELQEDRPLAKKVLTSWMSSCQEAASC